MDRVVDTNYLRKPELAQALQSSGISDRFVLTDTALLETMKNFQWESTARSSFQIIARSPAQIWLAVAPGELMRNELASGLETANVLDAEMSEGFRTLLVELAAGIDGPGLAFARANIHAAQNSLAGQQQNHADNLKQLRLAFSDIKNSIDLARYRRIVGAAQKESVRLYRIRTLAEVSVRKLVELESRPADMGIALAGGRGVILRFHIGLYCLGFKWAINQGLDSFPAKGATNELMDLDHAIIATYFDDILTCETSVAEMRRDILRVLNLGGQI